ncbi:MAG: DNA repair protein RecO [Micavibrio sp. TMED27]|nr:DNA repair protein RecO [Micavibrio sp.]OUT89839.1 MAG: DNA repair protein RecO [Micavibrio sp. TMED27]|tara:strand:- start:23 stop:796 length:774 start_codon:yes stop_codon:yes gene_type:complete
MEQWQDQGIVLHVRPHGESGAIINVLTKQNGRAAGYVRGARSSRMRGSLELGSVVDVQWSSRTSDGLGSFSIELVKSYAADYMGDALKLSALQSACELCNQALPEREKHEGLYHGLLVLFEQFASDIWGAAYVMWEIALLKELGFSLDLTQCAGGGDAMSLAYVSPKTGRAVSYSAGEIYKEKLLKLPDFLKPQGGSGDDEEILKGIDLCGYFLGRWVFAHHSHGIPAPRLLFAERFAKTIGEQGLEKKENRDYVTG